MHKTLIAAVVAGLLMLPATAEAGRRHHNGAGIAFGMMGAIIGSAIIAESVRRNNSYERQYRRTARHCANKWGWHTWRWERCMNRRGF